MWQAAQDGVVTIVRSPILIIKALVKPLRDGNMEIEIQYRELFEANAVRFLDTSYPVFEHAAHLRTMARLTTPDAIHAATALRTGCSLFITNDADFATSKTSQSPSWTISSQMRIWDDAGYLDANTCVYRMVHLVRSSWGHRSQHEATVVDLMKPYRDTRRREHSVIRRLLEFVRGGA